MAVLLPFLMVSCARPDVSLIEKDLGITIPHDYHLLRGVSEPFGLGSDVDQTFVFEFDSANCGRLEMQIMNTPLFNCAGVKEFNNLVMREKLKILSELAARKLSSYWVKSGTTYWFDGDSLYLNTHDHVMDRLPSYNIILPNTDTIAEDGRVVYTVRAVLDTKKRRLYYRYIHT